MSSDSASASEPSAPPIPHNPPCMFTVEQFQQPPESQNSNSEPLNVYVVRPNAIWEILERFKRLVAHPSSPTDLPQRYQPHDTILATRHDLPSSPLCTAIILEIRGHRPSNQAYIRLFWFYESSQLPGPFRNQPHHASRELIASNFMAVINANSIAGQAHVSCWREGYEALPPPGPFWRQMYDVYRQQLSLLPTLCPPPCTHPQNPDNPSIPCPHPACAAVMHKTCLLSATLTRLTSLRAQAMTASASFCSSKDENETGKKKRKTGVSMMAEWIDRGEGYGGYGALMSEEQGHHWVEDVHCLGCGSVLREWVIDGYLRKS